MNWEQLLSAKRLGLEERPHISAVEDRSQFQRDYDRIIFSAAFRRMQNKTQVFPLPGRIFVHNRLTHSLEVASVGRSLGNRLAELLFREKFLEDPVWLSEIGSVVSAACLAHDMGNPPFGHSGESAISNFFRSGPGQTLQENLSPEEWSDFTQFDGNANALRLLTHSFSGKRNGGFALTYTTLASIIKYPFESIAADRQKFGFFQSEKETCLKIARELGIPAVSENPLVFRRHPLVYLVEAADDICYQIMDVEDAFKLGILNYDETRELYLGFYGDADRSVLQSIERTLQLVTDPNEQVSYLRAGVIGKLIGGCSEQFGQNHEAILHGEFSGSLLKNLPGQLQSAMKKIQEVSLARIYNHRSVVEIEIAGYKIIGTLLEEFVGAIRDPKSPYSRKILSLLPPQYRPASDSDYHRVQSAVDFITGMTDVYALDLYRKIKGISLPEIG